MHYNLFYDPTIPTKHDGALLPPAAALAPTLWPQFHLRWACPKESQAGELEVRCRKMAIQLSEMQKVRFLSRTWMMNKCPGLWKQSLKKFDS